MMRTMTQNVCITKIKVTPLNDVVFALKASRYSDVVVVSTWLGCVLFEKTCEGFFPLRTCCVY